MEPPRDVKTEGMIGKLRKPLYGLRDASKFVLLKVMEWFEEAGMKRLTGYKALYYFHDDKGVLEEIILCHVDNLILAGK